MANILLAASAAPRVIVERILAGHDLFAAETMRQAEQLLGEQHFDLIICTIVFDESRLLDLLRLAKSTAEWQQIPFICARVREHILRSPLALEAVAFTCRALGAIAFLDVADYQEPEREMREAIERILHTASQGRDRH
jgi:CheY-like chemotaxis protein